ncbi:MAG: hypothetical protein CL886_03870 [Dehalococcoidia bacterium]|nr:hypothetical protein [Dehalococcoidia bacterium]
MPTVILQIGSPSPNTGFLFVAFAIVAIAFCGYSALIIRRQRDTTKKLKEIKQSSNHSTPE